MITAEEMLQEAKNNYNGFGDKEIIQLMKEYAKSVAQQALENASENATTFDANEGKCGGWLAPVHFIDKSSITNPDNIPTI